jgi:hypothetical protein
MVEGSSIELSIWTRPTMVPIMPKAGAASPMAL